MTQDQLTRIRLLSDRFHDLQGLRITLFGAAIAFSQVVGLLIPSTPPSLAGGLMLIVALVIASPGLYRLKHHYASTFGRQVRKTPPQWKFWVFFGATSVIRLALGDSLSDAAVTLAVVSALSLWVVARDWPFRSYYLLVPVAGGLALAASAAGFAGLHPSQSFAALHLALGLAMVPIGLLDHRLLVTLVREARAAGRYKAIAANVNSQPEP